MNSTMTFEQIDNNINGIIDQIAAAGADIEALRKLPESTVELLKNTGVLSMAMPKSMGGAELDPISQIKLVEKISRANSAAGWCTMIGADSGYFAAMIPQELAEKTYPNPHVISGAALSQTGKARKVPGGYMVSGRWPFVSGCNNAEWVVAGCKVYDGEDMVLLDGDIPQTRQCFLRMSDLEILDTWHVMGLRGTGSNDIELSQEIFIAEEMTFSFQQPRSFQDGVLYQFPMAFMFNFSAVPLGVAQSALDFFLSEANKPTRQVHQAGQFLTGRALKDESFVQGAVGEAAIKLRALRAFLYTEVEQVWALLQSGEMPSPLQQVAFLAITTEVFSGCQEIVETLVKCRGGSAVYQGNPLEQALRDIVTMNQHAMTSPRNQHQLGRALLGVPPEQILL